MNGATATLKGKSMFGVQELSRRRTAPAHGFGSSTRNHASKVFMGPEHAKTSSLSCTPGPCYEVNGACGSQYDSGKLSPPQWCFGTAERFSRSSRDKAPGPGAYENAGSFGRQGLSSRTSYPLYGFGTVDRNMASKVRSPQNPCPLLRRRLNGDMRLDSPISMGVSPSLLPPSPYPISCASVEVLFLPCRQVFISPAHASSTYGQGSPGPAALYHKASGLAGPKYGFGTDDRFNRLGRQLSDASELPGPGSYSSDSTLGSQHSSRLTTQPAFGFGSSNREHTAKIFLSDLHAKSGGASSWGVSPGPGVYNAASSVGRQATSRGRSAPTWGFGKASRFNDRTYMTDTPGPGSYST